MGKACLLRPTVFRAKLRDFMEKQPFPLNGAQVCRMWHGAKGKHDLEFCRRSPYPTWRDTDGFKARGGGALYEHCKVCSPGYQRVYYHLCKLEKQGWLESRMEYRTDPIVPGAKDWMRMWAIKGKLPSLLKHDHTVIRKADQT